METRHMTYSDVYNVIAKYAGEMLVYFADSWSRFPQGGTAAQIVNYLNDKSAMYYSFGADEAAKDCAWAAAEIITRERSS